MSPIHDAIPPGGPEDGASAEGCFLELERFLPYRLSVLANLVARAFAQRYEASHGLSIAEWRVLAVLGRFAPISSQEVSDRTAMDKAKVSRAVHRLVSSGLVARRSDPADTRRNLLALSRRGRGTYGRIVTVARGMEAQLTDVLGPGERKELDRLLEKLQQRVDGLQDLEP